MPLIDAIIEELRIPDLPYPVGQEGEPAVDAWRELLRGAWNEQADSQVIRLLKGRAEHWSLRQVNAGYLADRIMDVFLRTSGLHPTLARHIARLRFWFALRLEDQGAGAVDDATPLNRWLASLEHLRGWSDTGGRSSRFVLERLQEMVKPVGVAMETGDTGPLEAFVDQWLDQQSRQQERVEKLRDRLLATERGAARQRAAEQQARALVTELLQGRRLAPPIGGFIAEHWLSLLRQIAYDRGVGTEPWRHARRALEWLIWAGDPALSGQDRDRLYQVGEKMTDMLTQVWQGASTEPLPEAELDAIQQYLVSRLQGANPPVQAVPVEAASGRWLSLAGDDLDELQSVVGQWFVQGEGTDEQRRYCLALLPESAEVLWTNGQGVKMAVEPLEKLQKDLERERVKPLPRLRSFQQVLDDTLQGLARVLERQRAHRQKAVERAKAESAALRETREAARRRQEAEERERQEAAARASAEADAARQEGAFEECLAAVDALELGGWVEIPHKGEKQRFKLAVRIDASGKLIFVDRLGLNRTEMNRRELAERVRDGEARLLSKGAQFEDTLSRVVGRLRVGK